MPVASVVPTTDPLHPVVGLRHDVAMRLRALLLSHRDEATARLAQLEAAEDPTFLDDHVEISTTVASVALQDVEHALARFDDGTYGSCEVCGGAIPVERLEVIPYAATCVACAVAR